MTSKLEQIAIFMKDTAQTRLSYQDKWLVYDEEIQMWVVYQRKMYAKKTIALASGTDADLYNLLKILGE